MWKLIALFCFISLVSAQSTPPTLGGTTGVYGKNETEFHFWCHDATAGIYQYTWVAGFGYGNITEQNGTWLAEGTWVSCGTIGKERITISGDTWTSTWWYDVEGDTENPKFITVPKLPSQGNPIVLTKSGANDTEGAPQNLTADVQTCAWLNQGIDLATTNIGGTFQGSYLNAFCLNGNKFVRGVYNGTDPGGNETFAGYFAGVNVDYIGTTGHFVEVFASDCLQGCDIFKLTGDGNTLLERFWCTLDITVELLPPPGLPRVIGQRIAPAVRDQNERASCYFAAQPSFGYTTTPLANATFP